MGMFDQLKMAKNMLGNMSPSEMKELMEQAKESQKMLDEQIRKIVDEEIKKRDLVSRAEVEKLIQDKLSQ